MPDSTAQALDLAGLVERLRATGFRVDTRQYLTAHELLLAYAASGVHLGHDVARLTACLGPIFCTSPDEQERFAAEVADWLNVARERPKPVPRPGPVRPFQVWKRVRWFGPSASSPRLALWIGPAVSVIAIGIVCGLLWARFYLPVETKGAVQVQLADASAVPPSQAPGKVELFVDGVPTALGDAGEFVVHLPRAKVATVEARLEGYQTATQEISGGQIVPTLTLMQPPPPPPPEPETARGARRDPIGMAIAGESTTPRVRWPIAAVGAVSAGLLALGAFALIDRLRRRLALGQLPVHGDPEAVTLPVPEGHILPASELDLRRTAIALRRPRESAAFELDIDDTVNLTVRNAGFFQPRFSARRAMPEYVVLVSRRSPSDHQARTFDAVLKHLGDQDVVLDTYSFVDDPRTCTSDHSGESYGLRSVLERHHRATVIVAAETLCAFNRMTGRLASWVEVVLSHERRIFVTTEAPDRWTDRESVLEQSGFVVLPATEGGWRVLANVDAAAPADVLFPAPYTRPYPGVLGGDELRWLDRNEPPADQVERLKTELEEFLGPDAFAWMCGCAIYPEISWALTLRLKGSARPALLPAIARLPWFRHGYMPAWLRKALVARIPQAEDARLRTDLERLLEELAKGPSRAVSGSVLQIGRWIGPIDLLRAAPAGSPLQDRVFLGFMAGRRDALWLEAPNALRRLFKQPPTSISREPRARGGAASFMGQVLARLRFHHAIRPLGGHLAAAAAIALVSLLPLTRLLTIDEITDSAQAIWFVEIPDDDAAMSQMLDGRAFLLARTEVTVGQYNACVADGACAALPAATREQNGEPADWPIRNVSYEEAERFCTWLERQLVRAAVTGPVADALAGRRDGVRWQVTLPSDAQWAWAAKGGQYGRYPWGNDLDEQRANFLYASSYAARPVAVGSFPRDVSPFGVLDMVGNVREWTRTPSERAAGRLIRGAGFNSTAEQLEAHLANSGKMGVEARTENVGFRVAIAPLTPPVSRPAAESAAGSSAPESAACVPQTGGTFAPLYFPGDSIEITPASQQQLSAIVEALRRQKGVLTIEGHTPSGGAAAYNRTLSERRADIVSKYLMALGIDRSRLRAVAMGDTRPQCSNDTEAGRDANRRVEFRFATGNSAPTVRRIARSPGGIGLPPTQYTFTAEGATDPDGDSITYDWTISGYSGTPTLLKGPTVSQTLDAVGSYTVSLTVTDSGGASATATTSVSIGTITGVWTVACAGAPASFPTSFVATIRQDGNTLSGTLEAGGRAQSFPAPASLENTIRPGRQFSIGVEGAYNVWGDSDFYFNVTVDDNLETFTGTSQYCKSVRGVRRMPAAAK